VFLWGQLIAHLVTQKVLQTLFVDDFRGALLISSKVVYKLSSSQIQVLRHNIQYPSMMRFVSGDVKQNNAGRLCSN